jgi:hypothetical protein
VQLCSGGEEESASAGLPMWMLAGASSRGGVGWFDMMKVAPSKRGGCFVV